MSHEPDEGSGIELECPQCHEPVPYEDTIVIENAEGQAGCPHCGGVSPVDDWFE
jgi:endogenous inhibitor of DNA gyrase (YacG/DUF329 family)